MSLIIPPNHTFKHVFIENSNLIDPQPGYDGNHPNCPLYINHCNAFDFVLNKDWEFNKFAPLDIHRMLTRGIKFFEDRGMSGIYRNVDVFIGRQICPSAALIPELIDFWFHFTKKMIEQSDLEPLKIAWISHHMFEVIHPFIDGNGRTGRLLLNKILSELRQDPVLVYYSQRHLYYDAIQDFRNKFFMNGKFNNLDDLINFKSSKKYEKVLQ